MRSSVLKQIFLMVVLGISIQRVSAQKTYFVSPDGHDRAAGSFIDPFATWQKGHDVASAGDTIYLRGGTYDIGGRAKFGIIMSDNDGEPGKMIHFWAWADEKPVLDCSGMTTKEPGAAGILIQNSYWHFKGIEVKNVPMNKGSGGGSGGIKGVDCHHNVFELLDCHHNAGTGLRLYQSSSYNLILNSDFHDNYDPLTPGDPGGNADGASIAFSNGKPVGNVFRGCRAWNNSDDGFDLWKAEEPIIFEECWAFRNGIIPGVTVEVGDGNGFKMGRNKTGPKHVLRRCLAFENRANGFDDNVGSGVQEWINNTACNNGLFNFNIIQSYAFVLRNNLSIGADNRMNDRIDDQNNSWNTELDISNFKFVSLDSKGMDGPRKQDGNLPDLPYLKLLEGSDLIDSGTAYENIEFAGEAPDLGCFEF